MCQNADMRGQMIRAVSTELPLQGELAVFNENRADWICAGHLGQWVAIKGENILGFFSDIGSAYRAGLNTFGNGPFLVKQLKERETVAVTLRVKNQPRRA